MMNVLLDCVEYNPDDRIFAVVHLTTNEISVISSLEPHTFDYLGLDDCRNLAAAGDSVIVVDDEGEKHRIIRIE